MLSMISPLPKHSCSKYTTQYCKPAPFSLHIHTKAWWTRGNLAGGDGPEWVVAADLETLACFSDLGRERLHAPLNGHTHPHPPAKPITTLSWNHASRQPVKPRLLQRKRRLFRDPNRGGRPQSALEEGGVGGAAADDDLGLVRPEGDDEEAGAPPARPRRLAHRVVVDPFQSYP